MPRGRHRHSPPLHRLLPPSAIAGVSVVCALGPWAFSEVTVLRTLAAAAAGAPVGGPGGGGPPGAPAGPHRRPPPPPPAPPDERR
ncbi:hypothetical protein ACFWIO_21245, partial [Streptomyces diastatochromogenes]